MTNDRFTVPEVLFNPSDIGINQAGIPEAIVQTIEKCPKPFQKHLYANIVLSGGNCSLPGFESRLSQDLERLRPSDSKLGVKTGAASDPSLAAWQGMRSYYGAANGS